MATNLNAPIQLTERQLANTADKLGAKKAELNQLKKEVEFLEQLLEEHGPGRYVGREYEVNVLWISSTVFDQAKAKGLLTAGQLADCVKPSKYWRCNVKGV